jgi:hypothetical protein
MKTAFVLFLAIGFRAATATECDCPSSVGEAKKYADAIFRGTITDIREKTVYFQIARVWKGNVTKVFTMPEVRDSEMNVCVGFLPDHLRVGNDLLVYANRSEPTISKTDDYRVNACSRTNFAKDAGFDFAELGPGFPPLELRQSHVLIWVLLSLALFVMIGGWLLSRTLPRHSPA